MKNIILTFLAAFALFAVLFGCGDTSKKSAIVENIASAQNAQSNTNLEKQRAKKKLNPYEIYKVPSELSLEGRQMKLVYTAINAFGMDKDIPTTKKNLDNYKLELRQDEEILMVTFLPIRNSKESYIGGGTADAVDVTYTINKQTGEIVTKSLYK